MAEIQMAGIRPHNEKAAATWGAGGGDYGEDFGDERGRNGDWCEKLHSTVSAEWSRVVVSVGPHLSG